MGNYNVGKVLPDPRSGPDCFVWTIDDYFSLPQDTEFYVVFSPTFSAHGTDWYLALRPKFDIDGVPHTRLALFKSSSSPDCSVSYTFGIRGRGDDELLAYDGEKEFTENEDCVRHCEQPPLSMREDRDLWAPGGTITVFLRLQKRVTPCQPEPPTARDTGLQTNEDPTDWDTRSPKSCSSSARDIGLQTDEDPTDCDIRSRKSCSSSGKDVATQAEEEDFRNFEKQSDNSEAKSNTVTDRWLTRISRMYDTKAFANVRFVVNERVFEAHRLVLAMRSPEFRRMLTGANAAYETHVVETENVTEEAFDILLSFLYKNTLESRNKRSIVETYKCAATYQVQDLQDKCEQEMSTWNINPDEVCTLLDCGLDIPSLRDRCTDLLRREGADALFSSTFLQVSFRTLRFMLESDALENVPRLQRIERIMEWCVHPSPDKSDYASARNRLLENGTNPLLGRLGLQNLELKELSCVVNKYCGLITPEELVSLLRYQHTRDASVLPDWCLPMSSVTGKVTLQAMPPKHVNRESGSPKSRCLQDEK